MIQVNQKQQVNQSQPTKDNLNYQNIITYLDTHWEGPISSLQPLRKILNDINKEAVAIPSIIITGSNGKSTTNYFLQALCKKENIKTGFFFSPHFQLYNEYIAIKESLINNVEFTKKANILLDTAKRHNYTLHSHELLFGIFLLHSLEEKVSFIVAEQMHINQLDPVELLTPRIIGITRLTEPNINIEQTTETILKHASPTTFVISADQSKITLHQLLISTKAQKAQWIMPIRKVAALPYPFEQLQGRCATLAEKIASTYIEHFMPDKAGLSMLLHQPKKQRGRPTLEAKKQEALHPQKTIKDFWQEIAMDIPHRFETVATESGTVLLDCASSIDAFNNLFLGARLLSYKKSFSEIHIVAGAHEEDFNHEFFIKKVRYFFKRNNGKIIFCPITPAKYSATSSWNPQTMCNIAKNIKIKAEAYMSFPEAYKAATKNKNNSLTIVTGCSEIITEYWKLQNR